MKREPFLDKIMPPNKYISSIRPLTLKQCLAATLRIGSGPDTKWMWEERELDHVCPSNSDTIVSLTTLQITVVAEVLFVQDRVTNVSYMLDDSTACFEARFWPPITNVLPIRNPTWYRAEIEPPIRVSSSSEHVQFVKCHIYSFRR